MLDKWESKSKDDRGVVHVETIGYNQDGKVVCIFRRKVMVPKNSYLDERGGEQPGRPDAAAGQELARRRLAPRRADVHPPIGGLISRCRRDFGMVPPVTDQTQTTPRQATEQAADRGFFGQPRVLANLFGVEMWERFSFYGMQGIVLLYLYYTASQGGLGMDEGTASAVIGAYGGLVYLSTIPAPGWPTGSWARSGRSSTAPA